MLAKKLLLKGKAGMGNRVLSLVDAIMYAELSSRTLVVDWRDFTYSQDNENAFSKYFEVSNQSNIFPLEDIDDFLEKNHTASVFPTVWQGHLLDSVSELMEKSGNANQLSQVNPFIYSKYTASIKKLNYTEDILVRWAFRSEIHHIRRHLSNKTLRFAPETDRMIFKNALKNKLTLSKEIRALTNKFKKECFSGLTVGVHIRYTDRKTNVKKYHNIISLLLQEHPDATIFLATDNKEIEASFKAIHPVTICTYEKWYPDNGSHLHQNPDCPNRLLSGIHALVDMSLLASCKFLVCDQNSSFSYVASLMSDIPDSNIIDVSKGSLKQFVKNLLLR